TEIYRIGMPNGVITHNTLASRSVATATLEGPLDVPINNLLAGENVLTVEVHQYSLPNPDLVFAAEVEALIPVSEPATFKSTRLLSSGRLQVVMAGQAGRSYVIQSSTNFANWQYVLTRSNLPNSVVSILLDVTNTQQQFFRA